MRRHLVLLLDQDAYRETYVPRSRVIDHLSLPTDRTPELTLPNPDTWDLRHGAVTAAEPVEVAADLVGLAAQHLHVVGEVGGDNLLRPDGVG